MAEPQASAADAADGKNHGARIIVIWLVLTAIAEALLWLVWRYHLPPGRMSDAAVGQQWDIAVLGAFCVPVLLGIWTYFGYALTKWRRKDGDNSDGPPIHGNTKLQATWITVTSVVVLFLAGFGTYELIVPAGAGAGEGPVPIWNPKGVTTVSATSVSPPTWNSKTPLQVQAIGQQWNWTYRYPQFGGMETTDLVLPVNVPIVFHVTSLDVIHSFWAYKLGVKADANPGVDNVAYVTPLQTGTFTVRCNELCGIWHGAMYDYGKVETASQFQSWANNLETQEENNGLLAELPPYALTYDPTVIPQLGKSLTVGQGITGGNGYYYPSQSQTGQPGDPVSP